MITPALGALDGRDRGRARSEARRVRPGWLRPRRAGSAAVAAISLWVACTPDAPPSPATPPAPAFRDIAADVGLTRAHTGGGPDKEYIVEAKGGGGAMLDLEGDGDLDLYWVNGATLQDPAGAGNALYRNDGSAGFHDVAADAGVAGRGWGMGAASADVDNDGGPDLFVTCLGQDLLYLNRTAASGPAFADASAAVHAGAPAWSTGAAFGDADNDGDLDLYVSRYARFDASRVRPLGGRWRGVPVFVGPGDLPGAADVLLRNDEAAFTDVTKAFGVGDVEPAYGLGVLFVDVDDDGDVDLFVANDSKPNYLFRNDGGHFVDASLASGVAYSGRGTAQASMGVAWGDTDGDLRPDLLVTHFESDHNTLYRNRGGGRFVDASTPAGIEAPSSAWVSFGVCLVDVDNDGDRDLFVANGHVYPQIERAGTGSVYAQPNHLYANRGDGTFQLLAGAGVDEPRVSRTALAGDVDNDGGLDVYVHNLNDRPSLYHNQLRRGHWLGVRLVGTRSNRDGVGARVWVSAGGRRWVGDAVAGSSFLGSEDGRLHFGLGAATTVDSLVVRWPSARRQVVVAPPVDGYLTVVED